MKKHLLNYINSGDVWVLAGRTNAKQRQEVMHILTGIKLPQSRCGVTAIRRALIEISNATGPHLAAKERFITNWLHT